MSYLHGYSARFAAVRNPGRLAYTLAILAAVVCICALSGCVNIGELRADAEFYAEANRRHSANESLPLEARQIAFDNLLAWEAQAWELGGARPDSVAHVGT